MDLAKVKKRLIQEEGKKHFPYRCSADKISIGVGRNLEDRGISDITIDQMLDEDIDICVGELRQNLSWFDNAPSGIQDVLIDLAFNMGVPKLLTFVKTLELLRTSQYAKASDELLRSRYAAMLPNRSGRNAEMIRGHAD